MLFGDKDLQQDSADKFKEIGADDSQFNYKMWQMTNDPKYLDKSLLQFPQHVFAFFDKGVLLEKDPREAKFNLAVALWCSYYSSAIKLAHFYEEPALKKKIKELYSKTGRPN